MLEGKNCQENKAKEKGFCEEDWILFWVNVGDHSEKVHLSKELKETIYLH